MSQVKLNVNGKIVAADRGDTLMDAAFGGGVFIPQDCCSGQCETCRVRVVWGDVDDRNTAYGDTVLACQAVIRGDCTITFDEFQPASVVKGEVSRIASISPDVIEVVVDLAEPLNFRPGQYASIRFAGFPARDYSPTVHLNGEVGPNELVLHVKRLPGGVVSGEIGDRIGVGHATKVRGPLGSAFLRDPPSGRLLMASTGTGWAPIWSMARAACLAEKRPDMLVIAGAKNPENLYMTPALDWLKQMGVSEIITTVRERPSGFARLGTPDEFLPGLTDKDVVHVAGAPNLVESIKASALAAATRCYADSFTPSRNRMNLVDRVTGLFSLVRS
jgi:naphthalene 1,2-dioxygenase ferredoxin reductase component